MTHWHWFAGRALSFFDITYASLRGRNFASYIPIWHPQKYRVPRMVKLHRNATRLRFELGNLCLYPAL